ncbi:EamA family transporter [Adhaeribacter aquaticus]|uniref:EamA family transporter n=1 Tax=Adhaeribacter aquaticus TaxID=299567 RepID=UPI000420064C|nr:EamA family transporter [Adhaeribacter aquaticus]
MNNIKPPKWQIYLAFAAVYIIWGSTYLGVKFTLESMPPLLMSGFRFIVTGSILFLYCRFVKKMTAPTWANIKAAGIIGTLLIMVGNGTMALGVQTVPSSVAALLIATTPLWFAILGWIFYGDTRPNFFIIAGLLLGLIGIVFLIGPGQLTSHAIDLGGSIIILGGAFSWAFGSLYAAHSKNLAAPLVSTSLQMLTGGLLLTFLSLVKGEFQLFHVEKLSVKSLLALAYLIFVGSLVGYTAYSWLIRVVPPSQASTYAYVNPLVAVLLGWLFGGETISLQMIVAGAFILPGVVLILKSKARPQRVKPVPEEEIA